MDNTADYRHVLLYNETEYYFIVKASCLKHSCIQLCTFMLWKSFDLTKEGSLAYICKVPGGNVCCNLAQYKYKSNWNPRNPFGRELANNKKEKLLPDIIKDTAKTKKYARTISLESPQVKKHFLIHLYSVFPTELIKSMAVTGAHLHTSHTHVQQILSHRYRDLRVKDQFLSLRKNCSTCHNCRGNPEVWLTGLMVKMLWTILWVWGS